MAKNSQNIVENLRFSNIYHIFLRGMVCDLNLKKSLYFIIYKFKAFISNCFNSVKSKNKLKYRESSLNSLKQDFHKTENKVLRKKFFKYKVGILK